MSEPVNVPASKARSAWHAERSLRRKARYRIEQLQKEIADLPDGAIKQFTISQMTSILLQGVGENGLLESENVARAMVAAAKDRDVAAAKFIRESSEGALKQTVIQEIADSASVASAIRATRALVASGRMTEDEFDQWLADYKRELAGCASTTSISSPET